MRSSFKTFIAIIVMVTIWVRAYGSIDVKKGAQFSSAIQSLTYQLVVESGDPTLDKMLYEAAIAEFGVYFAIREIPPYDGTIEISFQTTQSSSSGFNLYQNPDYPIITGGAYQNTWQNGTMMLVIKDNAGTRFWTAINKTGMWKLPLPKTPADAARVAVNDVSKALRRDLATAPKGYLPSLQREESVPVRQPEPPLPPPASAIPPAQQEKSAPPVSSPQPRGDGIQTGAPLSAYPAASPTMENSPPEVLLQKPSQPYEELGTVQARGDADEPITDTIATLQIAAKSLGANAIIPGEDGGVDFNPWIKAYEITAKKKIRVVEAVAIRFSDVSTEVPPPPLSTPVTTLLPPAVSTSLPETRATQENEIACLGIPSLALSIGRARDALSIGVRNTIESAYSFKKVSPNLYLAQKDLKSVLISLEGEGAKSVLEKSPRFRILERTQNLALCVDSLIHFFENEMPLKLNPGVTDSDITRRLAPLKDQWISNYEHGESTLPRDVASLCPGGSRLLTTALLHERDRAWEWPKVYVGWVSIPSVEDAIVTGVERGSPAEDAGFQAGDVILGLQEGRKFSGWGDIIESLRTMRPKDKVVFEIKRGTRIINKTVTIKERPDGTFVRYSVLLLNYPMII